MAQLAIRPDIGELVNAPLKAVESETQRKDPVGFSGKTVQDSKGLRLATLGAHRSPRFRRGESFMDSPMSHPRPWEVLNRMWNGRQWRGRVKKQFPKFMESVFYKVGHEGCVRDQLRHGDIVEALPTCFIPEIKPGMIVFAKNPDYTGIHLVSVVETPRGTELYWEGMTAFQPIEDATIFAVIISVRWKFQRSGTAETSGVDGLAFGYQQWADSEILAHCARRRASVEAYHAQGGRN